MSDELIMDTSKEIFKINKDILDFIINPSIIKQLSNLPSGNKKPLSYIEIIISNITSEYIIIRVKSNKKEKFSVKPSHLVIKPNSEEKIKIIYYHKIGHKLHNNDYYKFKFEGFIINENEKNLDMKEIFNIYIQKKIKVFGNIIKINSKFTEEINVSDLDIIKEDDKDILRESTNSSILNSQQSDISILSKYSVPESFKESEINNNMVKLSELIINNNKNEELSDKEKLEKLKKEFNNLKEEIEKLKKNEDLLNKSIKLEKNKKNIIPDSEKFRFNVPIIKEKPFSRNILIGIFIFSALIGFYLVK